MRTSLSLRPCIILGTRFCLEPSYVPFWRDTLAAITELAVGFSDLGGDVIQTVLREVQTSW